MKVTSVEIYDTNTAAPAWHPVIVRINTDEGISGLGEVGLAYGTGHSAGAGMAKNLAEQFIIGADPFQTEYIWETMFRRSFWGTAGGPVVFGGMSGLDTALWDIKGKALGVPVYQLLGGKTNPRLRAYASQIQFGWDHEKWLELGSAEEYAEAGRVAVAEGYDAVKIDPIMIDPKGQRIVSLRNILRNDELREYERRISLLREAIGPDVDIIIELHSLPSATVAIQLARVWEQFNCMYFEEPVGYVNTALHELVAKNIKIPTSAGERIYTRWGYRPFFEKNSLSVIQPDLGLVGGVSECKKICDYAHIYDVTVQVHVCGSPIATAASLHVEAAIPNFIIHEHHTHALKPYNTEFCTPDLQPKNGYFEVPDAPGLGVELNESVIKRSPCVVVK
jgi:L-alanine-DL-glutamate epimerase-like enolase superfamily enzyme